MSIKLTAPPATLNGRYRVVRALGQGASALVFECKDLQSHQPRALKLLRHHASEAQLRSEFVRLSGYRHPHLPRVHDLDRLREPALLPGGPVEAGRLFLSMDLVRGEDPLGWLARLPRLERDPALRRIAADLARALAHLHGHGVVHHDLKPANVLLAGADRRAVLLDLGLASRAGLETPRGTLLYLAPEALAGSADFRADLWALGATLYHLAEGRPPFAGSGSQLVRAILEATPELQADWISADLKRLILALLRKDPLRRPSSARWVLAELARAEGDHRAVAELSGRPELLPPALVGRDQQLERLAALLAEPDPSRRPRLVLLAGPPGSGKSRLINEAVRRHRLQAAAGRAASFELLCGELREVLSALDPDRGRVSPALARWVAGEDPAVPLDELLLQLADRLEQLQPELPLVIQLPAADRDPVTAGLLPALAASRARPLFLAEVGPETAARLAGAAGCETLELAPLGLAEVATMVASMRGEAGPAELVARLAALSEGNPSLISELVRQWYEVGPEGLQLERLEGLATLLEQRRARLGAAERRLLDALAIWGQPASAAELCDLLQVAEVELWPVLASLAQRGLLRLDADRAAFPWPAQAAAWASVVGGEEGRELHRRAARRLAGDAAALARRAGHLLAAGEAEGPALALRAARDLLARHALPAATALLERAAAVAPEPVQEARALLAELYLRGGRYQEALELLDEEDPAQALLRAQVLQRRGDYVEAEAVLVRLLPRLAEAESRSLAAATLGRLLLQRGRPAEALAGLESELGRVLAWPTGQTLAAGASACLEVAGLARLHLGELAEAERLFAAGEQALQGAEPSRLARLISLRGMVALAGNEMPLAASHYRRALELLERGGDVHGRATYLANLGSILLLTGRYGEALDRLTGALRDLERLARNAEVASTRCNLANLLLGLGDLEQADLVRRRGEELAEQLQSPSTLAHLTMLRGDLARRAGSPLEGLEHYRQAEERFLSCAAPREVFLCRLASAEALAEAGRPEQARLLLQALQPDPEQEGPLAMSRARLQLLGSNPGASLDRSLEAALAGHCAALERRGAAPELWRAAALLGRLLLARGRTAPARRALRRARATWEMIMSHTPDLYRERLSEEPEARSLAASWDALLQEGADPAEASSASGSELLLDANRLRRLLAINKRLNSELRVPRLLETIMDTVIELTGAERGFLLLVEEDGRLSIKVARNIDQQSLEGVELSPSRSIAERASRSGLPVVTVDAAVDGRFQEALSVSDLNLRSVLAVPLCVKGNTVGTIYLDSRLRQGLFGEAEVRLVQDLADQAAIALENARLLAENRRRQREIERLNQKLRRKLQSQRAELLEVREELRSSREVLQQPRDHRGMVGRSPRMRELFHLLDRVVETELPVVIQGESGTGKELVARAIHQNGKRASHPFVSENCGAIPETLLESILFGHVRGAFTGADRDRKGLFEVASGGTLFLDEVGEMSPAMQTKLLRVLQDGELRRVGGTQTLRTDVRIIAASNKDLGRLVKEGRFREDLFYRLNVIQIQVPPLRERREDIPLLIEHFLEKHGMAEGRRVSPEALALLCGHAWPGNVRELENEVLRTVALAGKLVQPRDLSPHIAGSVPLQAPGLDEMNLKQRVEHLERELLRRALDLSEGNHTQAARRLGLSRFGLLKKLRRYGEESAPSRTAARR